MTPRPNPDRFDDVLAAADHARHIVEHGRDAFDQDVVLRLAAERVIELLAEAVNATVAALERAYPDYPWHEPISMRNLLAHEYWRSDPDLVWGTLTADIPEIEALVKALTDQPRDKP